jgi:hypothetical protein
MADMCEWAEPADPLLVRICAPRPGPPHRFLNDALGDNRQLFVLVLTQCTQPIQRVGFGSAAPAHHDADGALDHPTAAQSGL